MAITITTIENETTVASTGTGAAATNVFVPSGQEIGRYRVRVVRWVFDAQPTIGDSCIVTGITPKPDGTQETQVLWKSVVGATTTFVDQTSFPDECEWRGRIQVAIAVAAAANTLFLYHG